jgi:hypothetical protein
MRKMRFYSKSSRRSLRKNLRHLRWYINRVLQERPR